MQIDVIRNYLENTSIQQYKTDIGFRTLVESVNDNMYVIPKYQRKYRWSKKQVNDLIESLLKGLPIPPIYTYRNKGNQLEILDGQQRVLSLFFYYIGYFLNKRENPSIDFSRLETENISFSDALMSQFEMEKLEVKLKKNDGNSIGVDYNELPIEVRRKVDYTSITVIEIKVDQEEGREDVLRKIFANLNKGGSILYDQEIRNGVYNCELYDMLQAFNHNNKKWREVWGREDSKERDMEMLLRFCAMKKYVEVKGEDFFVNNYHSSYKDLLDKFSEEAICFDGQTVQEYKESLEEFVNCFHTGKKLSSSVALLESIYVVFEKKKVKVDITRDVLDRILSLPGYTDNSRQGTVQMKKMNERWKAVYGVLSEIN